MQPSSSNPEYEIHRAVNYYYNGNHPIPGWYYDEGIRLRALSRTDPNSNAYFTYSKYNRAYITVYYNNKDDDSRIIGSVLHELGHFAHYGQRGGYDGFHTVHNLICESFASYAGWCMGEQYYSSLGWVKSPISQDITGQSRQSWLKTGSNKAYYSPFFVDLVDDFNQGVYWGDPYNLDPIKNFHSSLINTISKDCATWTSIKKKLQQYIGVYYSVAEYNSFVAPYDYWFSK